MNLKEQAEIFLRRGWPIFPVGGEDGKRPLVKWGSVVVTTAEQVDEWLERLPVTGWGLPTGKTSGVVVVDVDGETMPEGLEPTYTVVTPRGGWHFYYRCAEPVKNSTSKIADKVDIRGDGGYVVLPGSVRPDGRTYVEEGGEIAPMPDRLLEACRAAPAKPTLLVLRSEPTSSDIYHRAEAYVDKCQPAISGQSGHAQTLSVARALVSGFALQPGDAMALLGRFNARCSPPWSEKELQHKIDSALATPDPSGRPHGYLIDEVEEITLIDDLPEPRLIPPPVDLRTDRIDDQVREEIVERIENEGEIGRAFLRWCRETARIWQPGLATGAVLTLGAHLAARQYHWRGTTSHLYVLGLAPSGTGKDNPAKRLSACLGEALMGSVPSTKVLRDAVELASEEGRGVTLVSGEVAKLLKQVLSGRCPAYLAGASQVMLELATWGVEPIRWDRPAIDQAQGRQQVIHAPCLSIYGTATPADLVDTMGEGAVADGLFGRFLVFRSQSQLPDKEVHRIPPPMPNDLRVMLADAGRARDAWIATGDPDSITIPPPVEIPGTAGSIVADYDQALHRRRQAGDTGGIPDELVARSAEHATRIAIALAGLSVSPRIDARTERLACDIAELCSREMAGLITKHAAGDGWERGLKRIMAAMHRLAGADGRVRQRDLLASVRAKETKQWIQALVDEGSLRVHATANTRGRPSVWYEAS
jgi:hypothetical protein